MNVLKAIKKGVIKVKAIRLFPTRPLLFIDSRTDTGEKPTLLVKSIHNEKHGCLRISSLFPSHNGVTARIIYASLFLKIMAARVAVTNSGRIIHDGNSGIP